MSQIQPDGYYAIAEQVAKQCSMTPDQIFGLLAPLTNQLNGYGITQDSNIILEGVSHVLPLQDISSPTFCQEGFKAYLTERLKNAASTQPPIPPRGSHKLTVISRLTAWTQPDYPGVYVTTEQGAVCKASVYYTDGTSPQPSAWELPRIQTMGTQRLIYEWDEDSPAYGGSFVVVCSLKGKKYGGEASFDILPILWPQLS